MSLRFMLVGWLAECSAVKSTSLPDTKGDEEQEPRQCWGLNSERVEWGRVNNKRQLVKFVLLLCHLTN